MYYFRHKPEKFKTFSREFGTVQTFNNLERKILFKIQHFKQLMRKTFLLVAERQNGVIIWLFVITILKILHESHLLISTISVSNKSDFIQPPSCYNSITFKFQQNSFLVKVWLLACAPIEIGATTTAFWMAYYANEKLVFGCLALFYLLFRIYAIWIVKESMHEIISVGVGVSQLELDPKSPTEIKESSSSS